jgi:signal transduction histidine kinase
MNSASIPKSETERLAKLYEYDILDSVPEQTFDQLTELASTVCNTPIALMTFVDEKRQWFKSHHGLDLNETPRNFSFCDHAINQEQFFEVPDSRQDNRFCDNPLVTGPTQMVFYAGAVLITPSGHKLGTLCVIDNKPSQLTFQQKRQLQIIANQVVAQLELRKAARVQNDLLIQSKRLTASLSAKNKELEQFVFTVSHDLKSPLVTIGGFTKKLETELSQFTTDKQKHRFARVIENVSQLGDLLTNLLHLSRVMNGEITKELLDTQTLVENCWLSLPSSDRKSDIEFKLVTPFHSINANQTLISQCIQNILNNAIRYRKPMSALKMSIHTEEFESSVSIFISDNGIGIEKNDQNRVFQVFEQVNQGSGNGVGLSIVKAAMEKHQGQVYLESTFGEGSCFELKLPKT